MKNIEFLNFFFFRGNPKRILFLIVLSICSFSNSLFSQSYEYTVYNNSNSGIGFNGIRDIEIDSQGNKWIVSNGSFGISKFNNSNWTSYNTANQQGTNAIHKIEFSTGTLESWVSVFATATINFANGAQSVTNFNHNYSTNILTVEIPINATNFQIDYYIEDSSASVDMTFYNLSTGNIIHQETFTGTMNKEYDYVFFTNIITNQLVDLSIDNLDNKWIGTQENGLIKFDNYNWTNFNISNSDIPTNNINCIATDTNNNIWIATNQGLTKFDGINWTTYNTSNSVLTTNAINSVAVDSNNSVWFTTGGTFTNSQLIKFSNNIFSIYNYNNGIGKILKIDSNNNIYCNSYWGFSKFDGLNWSYYGFNYENSPTCLQGCQVEALENKSNGNLMIGLYYECTDGGLQDFTECVSYNSFLPDSNISTIKKDTSENYWIGTLYGGLVKMSSSLGIDDVNLNPKFFIYPNPVQTTLTIQNKNKSINSFEYKIIDLTGRTVKNGKSKFNEKINVEGLVSGNYLIQVENQEGKTEIVKLIKN